MPIYEYQCQKCGVHLEKRQSVSDEPLKVCEECGGELVKQISLSGFQFKGAGWYVTDYAGKGTKSEAKPAAGGEKSSSTESTSGANGASNSNNAAPAKTDTSSSKD
jgi:putative FmdB family regulatory protein